MVSFKARRSEPQLVSPARATPRETKPLSDIDDQHLLRYYETVVGFFRTCPSRADDRPADLKGTMKAALAEALVYYYPVAGRLREEAGGKLIVDCTAEGVVFVEADADVRLQEFGEPLLPPYPCLDELLCDPGYQSAIHLFFEQTATGEIQPSSKVRGRPHGGTKTADQRGARRSPAKMLISSAGRCRAWEG